MKKLLALMLILVIAAIFGCITSDSGDDGDKEPDTTYTVSGRVIDNSGKGLSGVSVNMTGNNVNLNITTDSEGNFSFQNIKSGTYTVTPLKDGFVFSPEKTEAAVNNSNISDVNFTATVEGTVDHGSLADHEGPNATITQENISEINERVLTAFFSIINKLEGSVEKVSEDDTIRVDGENSGYALIEHSESKEGNISTESYKGDFFDYSDDGGLFIGGRLTSTAIENTETGDKTKSVKGDVGIAGAYKGTVNYDIRKNYGVDSGFHGSFNALSDEGTINGNIPEEDFDDWEDTGESVNEHSISGRILDGAGEGIPDIPVTLSGTDETVMTDKEGNYYFGNLGDGDYTVTPDLENYAFTPPSMQVRISGENVRLDFTGIVRGAGYIVQGRIVDDSRNGIEGIELSLTSSSNRYTVETDNQGYYTFVNIFDATYGLLPISGEYTFTPEYRTVSVSGTDITVDNFTAIGTGGDGVYSITGRVLDENGVGFADVPVKLVLQDITVLTDKEGNYYFGNLEDGMYGIGPFIEGIAFTPEMQVIIIDGADARAEDFTVSSGDVGATHSILGMVADSQGNALAEVTVSLAGMDKTTQTDKEGNYFFGNIADGDYMVIPSLEGYTFSPASRAVTIDGSDIYVEPFLGTKEGGGTGEGQYTVSGIVVNTEGDGIPGVSMTLGGGESDLTTVTDKDGKFEFTNIENGDYVLIPLLFGMAFTPTAQMVTVSGGDVTVNFTTFSETDDKFYKISGNIVDESGNGIPEVKISLHGGDDTLDVLTGSDGDYTFSAVKSGTYVLTPVREGYTFSPKFMQVTLIVADVTVDFTGYYEGTGGETFEVTGSVITDTGNGISGITVELKSVSLDGLIVGSTKTDNEGVYAFEDIFPGEFDVIPSREGFSFEPESRRIIVSDSPIIVDNFVGVREGDSEETISGKILLVGDKDYKGIENVDVKLTNTVTSDSLFVKTDENGAYSFSNIPDGEYTVIPQDEDYIFSPLEEEVIVSGSFVIDVDFVGGHTVSGKVTFSDSTGSGDEKPILGVQVKIQHFGFDFVLTKTEYTDAWGKYIFEDYPLPESDYRVTPYHDDYTFQPEYSDIEIKNKHLRNVDFTASPGGGGTRPDPDDPDSWTWLTFRLDIHHEVTQEREKYRDRSLTTDKGDVIFKLPINSEGEYGGLRGGGTGSYAGEGHSDGDDGSYCDWEKSGTVKVTISGNSKMQEDPSDHQVKRMLNIIMGIAYDSTMHKVCVDKEGDRSESTGPENKGSDTINFAIPMVDGASVSHSGPMGTGVTHNTKYTLHFGE